MQFKIKRTYDTLVDMYNLNNPENLGNTDQYVPDYSELGVFTVYVGVDALTGQMTLKVPTLIEAKNPYVINVRKVNGAQISPNDILYKLSVPVPVLDAYGNVVEYKYKLNAGRVR